MCVCVCVLSSSKQTLPGGFLSTIVHHKSTGRYRCRPPTLSVVRCRVVQALADRFVEAFAERLHADMRKNIWGYAPDEKASLLCYCHTAEFVDQKFNRPPSLLRNPSTSIPKECPLFDRYTNECEGSWGYGMID